MTMVVETVKGEYETGNGTTTVRMVIRSQVQSISGRVNNIQLPKWKVDCDTEIRNTGRSRGTNVHTCLEFIIKKLFIFLFLCNSNYKKSYLEGISKNKKEQFYYPGNFRFYKMLLIFVLSSCPISHLKKNIKIIMVVATIIV